MSKKSFLTAANLEISLARVKFDSDTKTISYQNKSNPEEYLKAQYDQGRWIDKGSNISQSKESYFVNVATLEIAKRQ